MTAIALVRALPRTTTGGRTRLTAVLVPVQPSPDPKSFDAVVLGAVVQPADPVLHDGPFDGDPTDVDAWADEIAAGLAAR